MFIFSSYLITELVLLRNSYGVCRSSDYREKSRVSTKLFNPQAYVKDCPKVSPSPLVLKVRSKETWRVLETL